MRLQRRWKPVMEEGGFFSAAPGVNGSAGACHSEGPAWDDQRWWRGHEPVSRSWTRLSVKPLCPMGWQGWALILPKRDRERGMRSERRKGRREELDRPIRQTEGGRFFISEKCAHVIQFNIFNPTGLCVTSGSFHISCNRQRKLQLSTLQFNLGPSFLGNEIFNVPLPCGRYDTVWTCYLTARKRPVWVILQLSRTVTPPGLLGAPRNDQGTSTLEHNRNRDSIPQSVFFFFRWSSDKLFSISARWFSVLVYHIISSKCNHNLKPQCLVWPWGNVCFSPFSCQWQQPEESACMHFVLFSTLRTKSSMCVFTVTASNTKLTHSTTSNRRITESAGASTREKKNMSMLESEWIHKGK